MNPPPQAVAIEPSRRCNNRVRRKRWLPWLGALALVALIILGLLPRPILVETADVARGPLRVTVNEEGKTRIRQRYLVSAPVPGQLRRISFKAGDTVISGQTVLAVIEPVTPVMLDARHRALAEAKRDTAAANLEKARAAHRFASSNLARFQKLHAENTITAQELESAQWRETAAARDEQAAASALREAEAELAGFAGSTPGENNAGGEPVEVKATVNGKVLRVFQESTRVVTAGTPLVEIGDPADLEVIIEVLSRDGAAISPGTKVELDQWGGREPLLARVRLVEPAAFTKVSALGVEEQRVNVVADLATPPRQRPGLGDNFRVEARIIVWESEDVLQVPVGALFRRGRQWAAFRIEGGRAALQPVEVGRSSAQEVQILQGLNEGNQVILYPGERVSEGRRVKPIQISP